jgi:D-glycero-alpha-D-manno-heptose-7-phosphate kinase
MINKIMEYLIVDQDVGLENIITKSKNFKFKKSRLIIFVTNKKKQCIGTISDGDIRRSILKKDIKNMSAIQIAQKNFHFVLENDPENKVLRKFEELTKKKGKYLAIPVLDKNKRIVNCITHEQYLASVFEKTSIIRTRVPCRISFSGGGTDFSKFFNDDITQVFSSTINKYYTISLIVRKDDKIRIIHRKEKIPTTIFNNLDDLKNKKGNLIIECIKIMSPQYGFDLEINSDVGMGLGLGGSSALAIGILGALNEMKLENKVNKYSLCNLAYQVERLNAGIVGGWQDFFSTAFGGFNWIEFDKNDIHVDSLNIDQNIINELEYNLLLFNVGKNRNSSILQKKIIKKKLNLNNYNQIRNVTQKMKKSLLKGNVKEFGDMLDASWQIKKKISPYATTKKIDKMYSIAKREGALGGKLLGAGQGGYLLIFSSPLFQDKIIKLLTKEGAKIDNFRFDFSGIKTWRIGK